MPQFKEEDDEQLIEAVKCCPEIYDNTHKNFKNFSVKENIWGNIAGGIGKDVASCKKRWKDIRDNYFKIKRKHNLGIGSAARIKWPLFDMLSFLSIVNVVKRERKSFSNTPSADEESQNDSNIEHCFLTSNTSNNDSGSSFDTEVFETNQNSDENKPICTNRGQKRKPIDILQDNTERRLLPTLAKKKKEDDDDIDLFMKSIAQTVKKLPLHLIVQAKMDILRTVTKLQLSVETGRGK